MKSTKRRTGSNPAQGSHESSFDSPSWIATSVFQLCVWTARLLILALLVLTPWFYGGAQWQSLQWIVWACTGVGILTVVAVFLSPGVVGHNARLSYYLLGLLLLGLLQVVSVPQLLSNRLNSHVFVSEAIEIAEGSSAPNNTSIYGQPLENTVSICSARSRAALGVLASALIIIWASGKLFCTTPWDWILAASITVSGICNAALGIVQRVTWNSWSLLEFPTKSFYSTFVSRNSASDYFAVAFGATLVLLGVAYQTRKRQRRKEYRITYPSTSIGGRIRNRMEDIFIDLDSMSVVSLCALLFLFTSSLVTYSRGGALSVVGAGVVMLCLALGTKGNAERGLSLVVTLVLGSVGLMTFFGIQDQLLNRLDDLNEVANDGRDGRLAVWAYSTHSMAWYWLLGSGLCTYQFALLPFHDGLPSVWFQHAESMYFEIGVEFGVLGLIIAVAALIQFSRDLFHASMSRRENVLLAGAGFAFFAVFLHSFVDFSLILPGVFLPLAALTGAFDGAVRKDETRKRTRGNHHDERERLKDVHAAESRTREHKRLILINAGLVSLCLFVQVIGAGDRDGFAKAEKLHRIFERVEKANVSTVADSTEVQQLQSRAEELAVRFPKHPEIRHLAGRIGLFHMRYQLLSELPWGESDTHENKWNLTHPHATLAFLKVASKDPQVQLFQSSISDSKVRAESLPRCRHHFAVALAGCTMDCRAAWGLYLSGLGQTPPDEQRLVGAMLVYLNRNNPELLFRAAIGAIAASGKAEPEREFGIELLRLAISLDQGFATRGLPVMLDYLDPGQIVALFPGDVVLRAKAARSACTMSEVGQQLSADLTSSISSKLADAVAQDLDGWTALQWASEQIEDAPLTIRILNRILVSGGDSDDVRFQLADKLFKVGEERRALQELEAIAARSPLMRGKVDSVKEEWARSMDRNQ